METVALASLEKFLEEFLNKFPRSVADEILRIVLSSILEKKPLKKHFLVKSIMQFLKKLGSL